MVSDILSGITCMLKELYPDHTVYRNPKDAGARLPCFFVTAPLGAQKQRLYDVMEEEPTIQIVRRPSGHVKTPTEENRRIAGELLRELRRIPAAGGIVTPYNWAWEADREHGSVQFQVRLRMRPVAADPLIASETTKGDVK